jgi:hypothetical protein
MDDRALRPAVRVERVLVPAASADDERKGREESGTEKALQGPTDPARLLVASCAHASLLEIMRPRSRARDCRAIRGTVHGRRVAAASEADNPAFCLSLVESVAEAARPPPSCSDAACKNRTLERTRFFDNRSDRVDFVVEKGRG